MFELFYLGGWQFMGALTILLILIVVFFILHLRTSDAANKYYYIVKNLGIMALALGVLGQLIGLFSAMGQIEAAGGISPAILAGGFKVSMICTMYGLVIFIISKLLLILKPKRLGRDL